MAGFDPDNHINKHNKPTHEQFFEERLKRSGLQKEQWPSQIDRAALDILHDIAIGRSASHSDIGGTIDRYEFPEATGEYYTTGLEALAGENEDFTRALRSLNSAQLAKLAFHLNEFRDQLTNVGQTMDIDRAIVALVEKAAITAIHESEGSDPQVGAGLRELRGSSSATDLVFQLLSDPRISDYSEALINLVTERTTSESLLNRLDEPWMTTPLWEHQKSALRNWLENDCRGYVDMATATGKTVLGLAAIAARYGVLHPADRDMVSEPVTGRQQPTILIVAGNDLLLSQWRSEFNEHLDIPPERTEPVRQGSIATITLNWGEIEFRTVQSLLAGDGLRSYDLTILDEAHRYSRGTSSGTGWRDLFTTLADRSEAILAMSGSIEVGWLGDSAAKDALEASLREVGKLSLDEARKRGVIADFSWEVRYVPTTTQHEEKLAEQTRLIKAAYDSQEGTLNSSKLGLSSGDLPESVESYAALRAFLQTKEGSALRDRSEDFDMFASALFTRRPLQWNLAPQNESIVDLIVTHAPTEKTVVLVQNYTEASQIGGRCAERSELTGCAVISLSRDEKDPEACINEFNEADRAVLIGPGDLLGVGVNMPDAVIGINVARGGVNASLVQRIGRVLRNPDGDKQATFYHLVPHPISLEAIDTHEDGRQLIEEAAEFIALGDGFDERPSFAVPNEELSTMIAKLERKGESALARRSPPEDGQFDQSPAVEKALDDIRARIRQTISRGDKTSVPVLVREYGLKPERDGTMDSSEESDVPAKTEPEPTSSSNPPHAESEAAADDSFPNDEEPPNVGTWTSSRGDTSSTDIGSADDSASSTGVPVTISEDVALVARAHVMRREDTSFQATIDSWVQELIFSIMQGRVPEFVDEVTVAEQTATVTISEATAPFVDTAVSQGQFDTPGQLVETAIRQSLNLRPGQTESVPIEVPTEILEAAETAIQSPVDTLVLDLLRAHVASEMDDQTPSEESSR